MVVQLSKWRSSKSYQLGVFCHGLSQLGEEGGSKEADD